MKQKCVVMSFRDLGTRVREHLNFNSLQNGAIGNHLISCSCCSKIGIGLDSFSIIGKC